MLDEKYIILISIMYRRPTQIAPLLHVHACADMLKTNNIYSIINVLFLVITHWSALVWKDDSVNSNSKNMHTYKIY